MNWFGQESLREMEDGTQTAGLTLFLQFEDDSEIGSVWEVLGSCKSLVLIFGMCLITLSKCV